MKLETDTIATLSLGDKRDVIWFDDELKGFGYRLRLGADNRLLRSWIVQYRAGSRSRRILLGSADLLGAKRAREAAKKLLARVTLGEDPAAERDDRLNKDRLTVSAMIAEYLEQKQGRPATLRATKRYLTGPYFKPLHAMAIDAVRRKDVAACIVGVTRRSGMAAAGQARGALSGFFTWAMQAGVAEANAVIGTGMPKQNPPGDRILTDDELVKIWNACDSDDDMCRITRLLVLTACRRSEIAELTWDEIDFERGTLTISSERAKNHRKLVLPIMPMMRDILEAIPERVGHTHLFGRRGFRNFDYGKTALDQRCGFSNWRLHDLRRSVASKLGDLGTAPHVIEALLNHAGHRSGVSGIYNKSGYMREITAAVALWHDHLRTLIEGGERKVLPLRAVTSSPVV